MPVERHQKGEVVTDTESAQTSVEKIDNVSHWTVEYTKPASNSEGRTWAQNGSTEAIFCNAYPEATVHVVRKTSRFRSLLIERAE